MVSESLQRNVAGVILAGGQSRRMGKDKAMLELGGVTLFDRVLQVMRGLFILKSSLPETGMIFFGPASPAIPTSSRAVPWAASTRV